LRGEAAAVAGGSEEVSYNELNRRANRLAHYLRKLGVRPDDRVGICVERSLEMVVGLLAILKAGGADVPLDPGYPEGRLRFMLQDSGPRVLLTQWHLRERFAPMEPGLRVIDLREIAGWEKEAESNPEAAGVGLSSQHLAYVIYTSGSTGIPKGVM